MLLLEELSHFVEIVAEDRLESCGGRGGGVVGKGSEEGRARGWGEVKGENEGGGGLRQRRGPREGMPIAMIRLVT